MGVTYLLDTHVFLWLLSEPERLPENLREDLADPHTTLLVSAVSAMEVATKARIGKLSQALYLADPVVWAAKLDQIGADPLPLTTEEALYAGSNPWPHRDPWDRLLAAQAVIRNVPLVTADADLTAAPGVRTRWR
jgi:PIN domain nuclease of toxin-antitoxin system